MNEERFGRLLEEMRAEGASASEADAARERVRDRLSGADSALCAQFRLDLGGYLDNRLTDSRRLLLEDHLARCTGCRGALAEAKGRPQLVAMPARGARKAAWAQWAVAAGVVLALLYGGRHQIDGALAPSGARARVVSVSGDAHALPELALAPGGELFEGDSVRTGAGARLILALADGSRVEANERTQFSVRSAWSGQTIVLDYGDLLVEAAPQSRGRLRVVTRDSVAAVKGTVFAVSSATGGSLVSVVEGEVEVSQSGSRKVLQAGEQAASNAALRSVRMEQAISWSQQAERYYGLLAELVNLEKDLAELPGPSLRTQARLLPYLPAGAVGYFAIPNLNGTIEQAVSLVEQRAGQNEALAEWWSSQEARGLREVADRIETITPLLGDEVLFAAVADPSRPGGQIQLLLAEIQAGREDELHAAISGLADNDDTAYEVVDGLLLASESAENLTIVSASLGGGASSEFATEIARRYEQGVSWLMAVDVAALGSDISMDAEAFEALGVATARYLFFERSEGAEGSEATLTFSEGRTGIATWLASPGPAGSAEYVSSAAMAAFSGSTRSPRQALDELVALLGEDSELAAEIAEFEAETGISLSLDIAASLGTDVTFAIERPTIPVPGWIVAFETMNPGALDETARRLVDRVNDQGPEHQSDLSLVFAQETVNGRAWRSIKLSGLTAAEEALRPMELHWTYDRGYLIASADRALAVHALTARESGSALIYSDEFERRFPAMSTLHHSGFFWFNTSGVAGDLASAVTSPALRSLLEDREPMLVVFDSQPERIHAASRTRLTSALLDAMLLGGVGHDSAASDAEQP